MAMTSVRWVKHPLQAMFSGVKIPADIKHRTSTQVMYAYIFTFQTTLLLQLQSTVSNGLRVSTRIPTHTVKTVYVPIYVMYHTIYIFKGKTEIIMLISRHTLSVCT
jgi:hypothetical protein